MNGNSTLVDLLRTCAQSSPDFVSHTFLEDGELDERILTYALLDEQARAVAVGLKEISEPGDRALLLYAPGIDYIIGLFGCMYAGLVPVPAYPPDPSRLNRTVPRLLRLIQDCGAAVAMTTSAMLELAEAFISEQENAPKLHWFASDAVDISSAAQWMRPNINSETLALIQYTSGSTSDPKGVMLSHQNVIDNCLATQTRWLPLGPIATGVVWTPPYHDMGLISGVIAPLFRREELTLPTVLMSPLAFLSRPMRWLEAMSRHKAVATAGPNFAYELCARKATEEEIAALDLSTVRYAVSGAEAIRPTTIRNFNERFAAAGWNPTAFGPSYGMAEATLVVSMSIPNAGMVTFPIVKEELKENRFETDVSGVAPEDIVELVGCGPAHTGFEITIVDPNTLQRSAGNEVGEIWVNGPGVANGYWEKPELSEQTFRATIDGEPDQHWLRTGDLGVIHDGQLIVTGRRKDLIIVRGNNFYPQDIELTVENAHPSLRAGCGAAFSIEENGEERLAVVQEIDMREHPDAEGVVERIRQAVLRDHEIPAWSVTLIQPRTIFKTSSGKIQRSATRSALLLGELDVVAHDLDVRPDFVEPSTENEKVVASILATTLQMERIGLHDNFFELGGTSLNATEFVATISERYNIEIPLDLLFESPTVQGLSAWLDEHAATAAKHRQLVRWDLEQPLSAPPWMTGWKSQHVSPTTLPYIALQIEHAPILATLERVLDKVLTRHEALHLIVDDSTSNPQLMLGDAQGEVPLDEIDLGDVDSEAAMEALTTAAAEMLSLSDHSLVSCAVGQHSNGKCTVVLALHPTVADLRSLEILAHEVTALYQALDTGVAGPLPEPELGWLDYVGWTAIEAAESLPVQMGSFDSANLSLNIDVPTDTALRIERSATGKDATPGMSWISHIAHEAESLGLASEVLLDDRRSPRLKNSIGNFSARLRLQNLPADPADRILEVRRQLLGATTNPSLLRGTSSSGLEANQVVIHVRDAQRLHLNMADIEVRHIATHIAPSPDAVQIFVTRNADNSVSILISSQNTESAERVANLLSETLDASVVKVGASNVAHS